MKENKSTTFSQQHGRATSHIQSILSPLWATLCVRSATKVIHFNLLWGANTATVAVVTEIAYWLGSVLLHGGT